MKEKKWWIHRDSASCLVYGYQHNEGPGLWNGAWGEWDIYIDARKATTKEIIESLLGRLI